MQGSMVSVLACTFWAYTICLDLSSTVTRFLWTELRYVTVHKAHNYEHLFCFGVVIS